MVKTTNVYFSAFQFRRVLLGVALLIFSILSMLAMPAHALDWQLPAQNADNQQKSQGVFDLLGALMGNEPSNANSFDPLFQMLAGVNCEKDDTHAQQLLLGPFQQLNRLLEGQNAFNASNWEAASSKEIMADYNNTIPMVSSSTTQRLNDPFIADVLTTVIPIHRGMIASMQRVCGPKHIRVARGLNFLAELYQMRGMQGDYVNAKDALLEALPIMTAEYPNHPDTAGIHNTLGLLYLFIGEYFEAKQQFEKAVNLAKSIESLGPNHPNTLIGLQNLASVHIAFGEYAQTERRFQEALDVLVSLRTARTSETGGISQQYDKARGALSGDFEGHQEVSLRQNMAHFYGDILGDHDKAERLLQEALALIKKEVNLPHPLKGLIHHGLGGIYQQQRSYLKAKSHYEQALRVYRKNRAWKYSPFSTMTLTRLGYLYQLQGDNAAAERVLRQAVAISKKVSEPKHSRANLISMSSQHLAMFYHGIGEFDKAEPLFKAALKTFKQTLGEKHPVVMEIMQRLAALKFDQRQIKEAVSFALEAQPLAENVLKKILSFGTEQQRLAYQKRSYSYELLARVANETGDATPLAKAILRNKGIVLDSLMEDMQLAGNPEMMKKIQSTKWQLMKLLMTVYQDNSDVAKARRASKREQLERQLKKLESGLARQVGQARKALDVEFQDVQAKLPKDSVLVEFIRYKHFVGLQDREAYYGAVIIPAKGDPTWVHLGTADAIEKNIIDYQRMMRCKKNCEMYDEEAITQLLQTLYQQVWAPIEEKFHNGIKTVILSPDGELNFLSFATLLTPDTDFLVQKFDLYYVASGRDLLREPKSVAESTMVVYALRDWKQSAMPKDEIQSALMPNTDQQAYINFQLLPLKSTLKEAKELKEMAESQQWIVKTFFDADATEKRLHQLKSSPRILHFATHGVFLHPTNKGTTTDFFLTSSGVNITPPLKLLNNPMHRSFLALAGAQTTLDAWNKGKTSPFPPENDGILTADEVSSLNLNGTWLTMFSACETGRGEGRVGEGVLGLRRGFVRAGTQNLLMTLWAVKDNLEEMGQFEREFYQRAMKTRNAPKALNEIQRKWLPQIWEDGGILDDVEPLLDAVRLIGPFVMSFQGTLGND